MQSIRSEALPFTVNVVEQSADLLDAVRVRQAAYQRHVPDLAEQLSDPESLDTALGSTVLLVRDKQGGTPLGSLRIQTNEHGPLALESSLKLPHHLQRSRLAEATRLGVVRGPLGALAKLALFKAFYLYGMQSKIDWLMATGRAPLDAQYEALMFKDVYEGLGYVPMKHVGGIPHRVLTVETRSIYELWSQANHPLFDFIFQVKHRDIPF